MNNNFFRLTKNINDITNDCRDCNDIYIDGDDDVSWLAVCTNCMHTYYVEEIEDNYKSNKTIKGNGAIMNNQVHTQDVKNKNDNILYVEFSLLSVFFETKEKVIVVLNNKKFIWIDKAYTRKNDLKLSFSASFYITNKNGEFNTIKLFDYNTVTKRYDETGTSVSVKDLTNLA